MSDDRSAFSSPGDLVRTVPEEGQTMVRKFLSEEEERAWLGLVEVHEALTRALDARLLAEHNMTSSSFEALMHIAHTKEGTISVSELAEKIRLSPSRVSRLAGELEGEGLVQRRRSPTDSRSTHVAITEKGWARLREAAPTYLSTIRTRFLDCLGEREVKQLCRIWDRIEGSPTQTGAA